MDRDLRIHTLGRDIRLVRRRSATAADFQAQLPATLVRRLLRAYVTSVEVARAKIVLRNLLNETARIAPIPSRTGIDWFLARVEQRIEVGDLIGVAVARPAGYGIRKEGPPEPLPPPEPPKEDPKTLDWIEIELVDEYGKPVPDEAYHLELADGVVKTGKLNSVGLARFDGIPPGTCKVTFPGFDGREWRPA